ncbi:hypothetical protein SFRURICE_019088 [Spodoptera frugiperda]|nr:hypothetical protein SFRURICE_019088 [Spodoptera frugiperda]
MATRSLLKSTKLGIYSRQCLKALGQQRTFTTKLTEQQQAVQELVRNFAEQHLKPNAAKHDKEALFPFEPIRQLKEMGLMGACASEDYGGMGMDYLSLAIAVEELSRGCASTGLILSIHNFLYLNLVNEKGTPEQKEFFLKDFTRNSIGCFALSEPGAGTDVAGIRTRAKKDGDRWILNGTKNWVTNALEGKALVTFATIDPELRHKGLACNTSGRAATACTVTLEDVCLPESYMVGQPGEGFKIAMEQLDQARIGIAAHAVGIAQSALDTAISYAKQRVAFGKPLTRVPSVKDRLTEMCMLVETARLATYRAAVDVSTKNSAMAKYIAGRNAAAVADHCVQILGGRGLSVNYDAERHYRDARGTQIYGGVTDIQKRLVGHFLLKEHDAL